MRFAGRFIRDESGTTAIEFGLVSIAFLTIVFGMFEGGRMYMTWNAFQYSLENATRYALVNEDVTEAELTTYIAEAMAGLMAEEENIDVTIEFPVISDINFIEVEGTYSYEILAPFLPASWENIVLSANSRLPRP